MSAEIPRLSDATLYSSRLPADRDRSEDAGFILTARTDDHDLYLYLCPYVVSGAGEGIWIVPDGRINGTLFFAIPHAERGRGLRDNAFHRSGWHLPQYLEPAQHEIVEEPDRASWRMGGRCYTWRSGSWSVTGEHAGVKTDLVFRPVAPAAWRWGPWEDLVANDSAGYKVSCVADGRIEVGGRSFEIRDGYATHERAAVGQSRDIVAEMAGGAEVYAFEIRGDDLDVAIHRHTGRGIEAASVQVGSKAFQFGAGVEESEVLISTLEHWTDPRSGLSVPARWQVAMSSPHGLATLEIRSSGRSYFHYNTGAGVMVMMQILGVAEGSFHAAGGGHTPIRDAIVGLRWGRALLFAEEPA